LFCCQRDNLTCIFFVRRKKDPNKEKAALTCDPDDEEAPEEGEELCDEDHDRDDTEDHDEVTWGEVGRSCCCHTPKGWFMIFLVVCLVLGILYFFILSLDLLSTSAQVLTGCAAAQLFENTNPIAALMVGILATVLLQSSSTTTSIIVSLVGAGLDVQASIYMVMGSNIGTSVTNTLVAMGQMGNGDELERAFAGATVHDMFNFLTCLVLLPVEVVTGYLYALTKAMVKNVDMSEESGSTWRSPIRTMTDGIVNAMIISNRRLVAAVADGGSCDDFYPVVCQGGVESFETCTTVGLIRCNSANNKCPAFFQNGATAADDKLSGGVCLFISLLLLFLSLLCLVAVLHKILMGASHRIILKATDVNGYLAMAIGAGLTMVVQSSTVATATLTPLVGLDVIRLEQVSGLAWPSKV
jgi:sodium-dependent phosphate cotransporter